MTREETSKIMAIIETAYPTFYRGADVIAAKAAVKLWAMMFDAEPYQLVQAAVKALIATDEKGFPPTIGQVKAKIRLLTQKPAMTEQEAWALVSRACRRAAYYAEEEFAKLPPEIQAVVHDPAQLKAWALSPEDSMESVIASNFQRSYRAKMVQVEEVKALPSDVRNLMLETGRGQEPAALPGGGLEKLF